MVGLIGEALGLVNDINTVGSNLGLWGGDDHAGRDQRQATDYAIRQSIVGKVAAAKEAGISPLYALGAPVMSASSAVGTGGTTGGQLSSMGQDISGAVAKGMTPTEKQLEALALEKAGLENEHLRAQIGYVKAQTLGATNPGMGIPEVVQNPQRTKGVNLFGYPFEFAPSTSDVGNSTENRYGDSEIIQMITGAPVLAQDIWWNSMLRKAINEKRSGDPSALRQIFDYLF